MVLTHHLFEPLRAIPPRHDRIALLARSRITLRDGELLTSRPAAE
jgi:hypothetical protein